MLAVNTLIQEACEDLSRVGDGEQVPPELAASCEGLLNRAITQLNTDSYISLTINTFDIEAAGNIYFRKLEEGEVKPANTIDSEPPDMVQGLSRKVGIRWATIPPSNPESIDRLNTTSLPTRYCYGVDTEVAPSGNTRRVGIIKTNGTYPCSLRVYENSSLPHYKLGDMIYLSPLYHDLILYTLEMRMVKKYKLYSYQDRVKQDLDGAMAAIDTHTAANRPLTNDMLDPVTKPADDLLSGYGF